MILARVFSRRLFYITRFGGRAFSQNGRFSTEIEHYQQEERLRPAVAADTLEESQQGSAACTKVKSTVF
jgi:hypothetical protein